MRLNHFFLLDKDPVKLAASLADDHLGSMIELCTAIIEKFYSPSNNSVDKWVDWALATTENYTFVARTRVAVFDEFYFRFGKEYSSKHISAFKNAPPVGIPEGNLTTPPIEAGSLRLKDFEQAVTFARLEYMKHSSYLKRYTKRGRPGWMLKEDALGRAEFAVRFNEIRDKYRTRR